ncbi:GTPase HflX [Virgibacillus sp. 179-BFC.A HS]|uniref:GTPase HflX n=1 Tax=Tigheibacillus jepli TaxID=3035914 RepID=A0ABU5CHG9_9BACI|nr:GTPase HflX [Virgibacillus sp. 179-BFC.A HS]MDY0405799.1 GTPase HflX [Virgibacillus sp. 179-BFC.A HS]
MPEKVMIIAVKKPDQQADKFRSSLDEVESLVRTAGGEVKYVATQNRMRIHPALYIGEGKAKEIKNIAIEMEIDLVVSNDELSAGQSRNLSDLLGVRLIDRSQLILDIFAQRARTREGKLQVELAQLAYLLPRLRGQGTQLSRLGGGIGTRGPGETKLETDQRHIRQRMDEIKRRLKSAVKQRGQYRNRRKSNDTFQIAIVGYTNAGKSTLFNRLTNSLSLEENQLFATLDPLTRKLDLPSGFQALVTDTVGFIQDLPTSLIAAFRSTLEEVKEADFVLHVVDSSHPNQLQQQQTVKKLLHELDADTIPVLTVYNKKDLLEEEVISFAHPYIVISAWSDDGIQMLKQKIETELKMLWQPYEIYLPAENGSVIHHLRRKSIIVTNFFDENQEKYLINGYIKDDNVLQSVLKGVKEKQ